GTEPAAVSSRAGRDSRQASLLHSNQISFWRRPGSHLCSTQRTVESLHLVWSNSALLFPLSRGQSQKKARTGSGTVWWGETPSSPDFCPLELRAQRSLAPPRMQLHRHRGPAKIPVENAALPAPAKRVG